MNQGLFVRKIIRGKVLPYIRSWVYKRGFRPKLGDILYSPSLDLIYVFKEANISEAFAEGLRKGRFIK